MLLERLAEIDGVVAAIAGGGVFAYGVGPGDIFVAVITQGHGGGPVDFRGVEAFAACVLSEEIDDVGGWVLRPRTRVIGIGYDDGGGGGRGGEEFDVSFEAVQAVDVAGLGG